MNISQLTTVRRLESEGWEVVECYEWDKRPKMRRLIPGTVAREYCRVLVDGSTVACLPGGTGSWDPGTKGIATGM